MEFKKLIEAKQDKLWNEKIPTVAFFGDSITQGCFEFYMEKGKLKTVFDRQYAPCTWFDKKVMEMYPSVPLNIINAGLSGSSASDSAGRVGRDVTAYSPDLTVVSFGLNDAFGREAGLSKYCDALHKIFGEIKNSGSEIIFMTQNMFNTEVSPELEEVYLINLAKETMDLQLSGICDMYFGAAKEVATELGAEICDVYEKWKTLPGNKTNLLANKINHPTREMTELFASELFEVIFR